MPQSLPLPRLTFRSLMGLVLLQSLSRCCSHLLQREDGLSPAEKATTVHQLSYDDFLEDDLDEELDIDIQQEAAARLRYTAILLIPFMMKQELGSIINTVWVFLRKVWALSLTAGAVDTASVQSLPAMYIAKQHFCRLQDVPANVSPDLLKDMLCRYALKIRKIPAFAKGLCFHRVSHPVTGADTDTVKGLVIAHPNDQHRWRHAINNPMDTLKQFLVHYPLLSCTFSSGHHYEKFHDVFIIKH
ncbi:unnamed protein product [Closterium sp. NIES-53]